MEDTEVGSSLIAKRVLGNFNVYYKDDHKVLLRHEAIEASECPLSWQYGGDIAANMILASSSVLPSDSALRPMSVRVEYITPGSMSKIRNYHVEKLRQSERFMHTLVTLKQDNQFVATANITFHNDEHQPQSLEFSPVFPDDCPMPSQLTEDVALLERFERNREGFDLNEARNMVRLSRGLGFETKPVIPLDYFRLNKEPVVRVSFWLRFRETEIEQAFPGGLDITNCWSSALLAYASDYRARSAALRQAPSFEIGRTAAMTHAMWLAPDYTAKIKSLKEWFLYDTRLLQSGNNTTLCEGHLWNENKQLLASVTQQGLVRPKNS